MTRGVYVTPTTNRSRAGRPHRRGTTRTAATGAPTPTRSTGSGARPPARPVDRAATARSRCSPRTGRPAIPSTAWSATRSCTNLVHAAAIRSTGVSSSPALAELVRDLLEEAGAPVGEDRPDATLALRAAAAPARPPATPTELFALDPRYGQVICACEQVTRGGDRRRVRDAPAAAHARRRPQAHARHGRTLPGRVLHGRRLVPLLRLRRPAAGRGVAGMTVAIVGAGVTGLACARGARRARAVVRRPDPGLRRRARLGPRRDAAARGARARRPARLAPRRDGDHVGRRGARDHGPGRRARGSRPARS